MAKNTKAHVLHAVIITDVNYYCFLNDNGTKKLRVSEAHG
jgi:hypothetical protein